MLLFESSQELIAKKFALVNEILREREEGVLSRYRGILVAEAGQSVFRSEPGKFIIYIYGIHFIVRKTIVFRERSPGIGGSIVSGDTEVGAHPYKIAIACDGKDVFT